MKQTETARRIRNMQIRSKSIAKTQSIDTKLQQLIAVVADLLDVIAAANAPRPT